MDFLAEIVLGDVDEQSILLYGSTDFRISDIA